MLLVPLNTYYKRPEAFSVYRCTYYQAVSLSICLSVYFPVWHQPSVRLPSNLSSESKTRQPVLGHEETAMSFSLRQHRNNPPYSNIWWHRNLLHRGKRKHLRGKTVSIYRKKKKKYKTTTTKKKTGTWEEITVGLCYLCGCLLKCFWSFGFWRGETEWPSQGGHVLSTGTKSPSWTCSNTQAEEMSLESHTGVALLHTAHAWEAFWYPEIFEVNILQLIYDFFFLIWHTSEILHSCSDASFLYAFPFKEN